MAILNLLRQALLALLLALLPVAGAHAAADFIALCYHEVESDHSSGMTATAVRAGDLAAQLAWLQASGYHPISLQQVVDARNGGAPLPEKAVLLSFDDGKKDVYTRVFPLLKLFRFPAVVALVGHWLDVPEGGTVDYDGKSLPRNAFVSWQDVREMQRSGLVEIASHSYNLHRSVLANPQGNAQPSATSRLYADGAYEADEAYLARLHADLRRNRDLIERQTGVAPRAVVWPYGRSNGAAKQLAEELGMPIGLTLVDGRNTAATPLSSLKRYLIEDSPSLQSFAEALRQNWSPDPARSVRIVPAEWLSEEAGLSQTLDRLQRLSINIVFVDPRASADDAGPVYFPSSQRPPAADVLNRIAWQVKTRAGSPVFIDLPQAWLTNLQLLADLARHVTFDGVRMPLAPGDPAAKAALAAMTRWRWPLNVAYAPATMPQPDVWQTLPAGDFVVLPATTESRVQRPLATARKTLFEFDPASQPAADIAREMRRLDADGFRQFGLSAFPETGFDPVWSELSLRSQPLLK